jgi:hypothetical protein
MCSSTIFRCNINRSHYRAVPFLLSKIFEIGTYNNNGSLVYSLEGFDIKDYFLHIVKIICMMEYEARYQAFEILSKYAPEISDKMRENAIALLEENRKALDECAIDKGENSTWHFVEQSIKLLYKAP